MHKDKISKIVYGFLMLLPLMAVCFTSLYAVFNKNAYLEQDESTINYKYETNDVNDFDDLIQGNAYNFSWNNNDITFGEFFYVYPFENYDIQFIVLDSNKFVENSFINDSQFDFFNAFNVDIVFCVSYDTENGYTYYLDFYSDINTDYFLEYTFDDFVLDIISIDLVYFYHWCPSGSNFVLQTAVGSISKCENIPIESVTTTEFSPKDAIYYGMHKVESSDYFCWAKNTIIYTGLNTIFANFNVNAPFITLILSYWLWVDLIVIIPSALHWFIHLADKLLDDFERKGRI